MIKQYIVVPTKTNMPTIINGTQKININDFKKFISKYIKKNDM
jgi:hypothetical protein